MGLRVVSVGIIVLVATAAFGDEVKDARTQARAHFRAGTAFYDAGQYTRAIEEYQSAYRLFPLPELLFNLAQAYRLDHQRDAALDYYQRYLTIKQTGAIAVETRAHLAELQQAEAPSPPPPEPLVTDPPQANVAAAPALPLVSRTKAMPPAARRRWLLPVILVGSLVVAGVAIGVGVGVGASATHYPTNTFGEVQPR